MKVALISLIFNLIFDRAGVSYVLALEKYMLAKKVAVKYSLKWITHHFPPTACFKWLCDITGQKGKLIIRDGLHLG